MGGGRYLYRNINRIMKYIRRFKTSSDYEAFKTSDDYITPHIVLCEDNIEKPILKEESIFPLYLTVNRSWENNSFDLAMYWEIDLPNERLYNELNDAFIWDDKNTQIMVLPDGWLDEHPIFVDGHKVIGIQKEYSRIFFNIEDDYPYNEIINGGNYWVSECFTAMDGPLKIVAYCSCLVR